MDSGRLVKRFKDSGMLSSSVAVCDVNGSVAGPTFHDGTLPLDTSIELSLLLAEVADPPFCGSFITFGNISRILDAGGPHDTRSLIKKAQYPENSRWSQYTNSTAAFQRLIIPLAVQHKLKQEDLVTQIFVFSDMQFDASEKRSTRFDTA